MIDELSIYTGALNAAKVKQRYLDSRPTYIAQERVTDLIKIYPTSFKSEIKVSLEGLKSQVIQMSIHSVSGMSVYQSECSIDGNESIIIGGLDELPKGIYTLSILTDQGTINRKLMK